MIFSPFDPFNLPPPQVDPDSERLSQFFVRHAGSANLACDQTWGIPVWRATASDPYVIVDPTKYNRGAWFGLRLPKNAIPQVYDANGYGEGKMVVFSPTYPSGVQYETDFFGVSIVNGVLSAEGVWQQHCDSGAGSTTVVQQGILGHVTGSGIMQAAGLILASEIAAGWIPHALAVTIPETKLRTEPGAFRHPANQTDGKTPGGVPMGAHIQLDPAYDTSALPRTAQIVARAAQTYGAYVVDSGDSFSFYAESSLSAGPYLTWSGAREIRAIDWSRLRVLDR